jgi:hypothetical protein
MIPLTDSSLRPEITYPQCTDFTNWSMNGG